MQGESDTTTRADPTTLAADFSATFAGWLRLPVRVHLLALLVLVLVPMVRWWPQLSNTGTAFNDEVAYFEAFEQLAVGGSPFDAPDYLYPAVFAYAGRWSLELLGRPATALLLRGWNLLGLAVAVWCSLAWLPWSVRRRLVVGSAFTLLAPQVSYSVVFGNFSLAIAGMVIAGLLLAGRRPVVAGTLLGASVALKPIAPLAVGCLLLRRRRDERVERRLAALLAMVVAAALILSFPYLAELLALLKTGRVANSISLHRFPALFGLELNALWVSAPLALAALAVVLRGGLGEARFLCLALVASIAATPLVWSHTLAILLPLEVLALIVAARRWSARGPAAAAGDGSRTPSVLPPWFEPVMVVLAVAAIQFSSGAGSIDDQSVLLQLVGAGLPALAPLALLGYLLRTTDSF